MDETKSTGERLYTGYFDRYSLEHLHRYAIARGFVAGKTVLDIASGEGYGSNLMAEVAKHVVGVDVDSMIIDHASSRYRRPNLKFLQGSTDQIPIAASSVDVVVSFETLEHHDRHEEMYREIKRVLVPGGLLVISTPDKKYFSDLTGHRNDYHIKELYKEDFLALTKKHFQNVTLQSQVSAAASIICGDDDVGSFSLFGGDHHHVRADRAFQDPAYHICFASDASISDIAASVFESRKILDQHPAEVDQLNRRLAELSRMNEDLRQSLSFRLGRALVAPLRFFVRRQRG